MCLEDRNLDSVRFGLHRKAHHILVLIKPISTIVSAVSRKEYSLKEQHMLINVKKGRLASFLLAYLLCFPALSMSINNLTHMVFGEGFKLSTYALYFFYYLLLGIFVLQPVDCKITPSHFAFTVFLLLSCGISFVFCEIKEYWWTSVTDIVGNPFYQFLLFGVAGFYLVDYLDSIRYFMKILRKYAMVSVACAVAYYFMTILRGLEVEYMSFSYNILLPTLFLLLMSLQDFRLSTFICAIAGAAVITVAGSRGALLCLLSGGALYELFFAKLSLNKRILLFLLFCLMNILIALFWSNILQWLASTLAKNQIESRTVDYLIAGDFLDDSGRFDIYEDGIVHIGLLPKGLLADRKISGFYVHNLFIEILIDYGYVLGGGLILILAWLTIRSFAVGNREYRLLLVMCFAAGILKLCFSSSFLGMEAAFYTYIGVMLRSLKFAGKKNDDFAEVLRSDDDISLAFAKLEND